MGMVVDTKTPEARYIRRTDTLMSYLEEIRDFKPISILEERELFNRVKHGDKKARELIINSNQRFVVAVAKRFATADNLPDLINEGNIGLIQAIDNFDNTRGVRFITHAIWYIRREINAYRMKTDKMVKIFNQSKTFHVMNKIKNTFYAKEGRMPTSDEIIEILEDKYKCSIKNKNDVLDVVVDSIDDFCTDADKNPSTFEESNSFTSKTAEENAINNKMTEELNKHILSELFTCLSDREQKIISLLYGLNGELRPLEIREVADIMKMSMERIRQLKFSIIEKLQEAYRKLNKSAI